MDNTLDILNEILGTLGQVKHLMESKQDNTQYMDVQSSVINQAMDGRSSNAIGNLLNSLSTYIKQYDEKQAKIAIDGFEYFLNVINGLNSFNSDSIKNIEDVTTSFSIFTDVINNLLSSDELLDEKFANITKSKGFIQSYINLLSSLDWNEFTDAINNIPDESIKNVIVFNNAIESINSIIETIYRLDNISNSNRKIINQFTSKKFFKVLTNYTIGMGGILTEITKLQNEGNIPNIQTTKSFVNASNYLMNIIYRLSSISIIDIITFKMLGPLLFSAMRQYIKGMNKTLNLVGDNIHELKSKAEVANIFVNTLNGVIKAMQQLSIATVMMVGSMVLSGLMINKWWDVIWKGGLMTMSILGLSLGIVALFNKFNLSNIRESIDSLQELNIYFMALGGATLVLTTELLLIGKLYDSYSNEIELGKTALYKSIISMGVIIGLAHLVLTRKFMSDIEQTVDKLYSLQLVTLALSATAFANAFIMYKFASYISGKETNILYGFTASSLILVSTMGVATLLGKMYRSNSDDISAALLSLAAMGLLIVEYKWVTEKLLDLGLMIEGHETQLLKSSLFIGGIMLGMVGIVGAAGALTKTFGVNNMLIGILTIGASAGILHYMTYITSKIVNTAEKMQNVNMLDLLLTVGIMNVSITSMVGIVAGIGAITLYVGWPVILAGVLVVGSISAILHSMISIVDRVSDMGIKYANHKDKITQAGDMFKLAMTTIGDMWKMLISLGDPDEQEKSMSAFMAKIPVFGTWFKSGTMMLESVGIAAMLGSLNIAVNLVDKILGIAERYAQENPVAIRTSLSNMLGIVNQFIPDLMQTLENIDAKGLDAWKSKWWDPKTWGQGSRMGVIIDAVKMTSDIMNMISKAGQMKIIKEFDANGNPIYETLLESDITNAAKKIALSMSIFVNALFTELSKVEIEDSENLKRIKKLFDGGMFSTGLIGMTNSFINSVHKLGQGWVEEDGEGGKTYHRIDINHLGVYGTNLGLAVSNFVTSLTNGLVEAGESVNRNHYKLKNFKDLMIGGDIMSKGLLGTTNFIFKFIDKFMNDDTIIDENGNIIHKSGISVNDMPIYGSLLGTSVSNFINNITSSLIKIGDNLDSRKINNLQKFNDLMLGGGLTKHGLFTMINRIVKITEAIKSGEDYYDEDGKLHRGSGYAIERLPEVSGIIGISFGAFIRNFKNGIDTLDINNELIEKSNRVVNILIGDNKLFGGHKGLMGIIDRLIRGLSKSNINIMDSSRINGILNNTRIYFNNVLGITKDIQTELQTMGFFTRDNVNDKALKNYEKYLLTLSKILTSRDLSKLTSYISVASKNINTSISNISSKEADKLASTLSKMNHEIITKHSERQKALNELTESLQKVGDQFERIGNSTIPNIDNNITTQDRYVSLQQNGKEINLSKETLDTIIAAIAELKNDASVSLSSRNIIVELNNGGELSGRLMYDDIE